MLSSWVCIKNQKATTSPTIIDILSIFSYLLFQESEGSFEIPTAYTDRFTTMFAILIHSSTTLSAVTLQAISYIKESVKMTGCGFKGSCILELFLGRGSYFLESAEPLRDNKTEVTALTTSYSTQLTIILHFCCSLELLVGGHS